MAGQAECAYDLFTSYAEADRAWVEGYLLAALGLPSDRVITPQDFRPGAPVVAEFERAVRDSRYTLLVLTPAYLADEWSTFGEQLISHASVTEQRDRLIPLLLRPCTLPLRVDFRVRLDCTDEPNWEGETARLRDLLDQSEPVPERIPCPYPGMVPFSAEDARFFYGREAEIQGLLRLLRHHNYLFVIGPSGSGKSSLIFAGLVPELHERLPGQWLVRSIRPGPDPMSSLEEALGGIPSSASQPIEAYRELISSALSNSLPIQRLLLVVDQFEELFTQAGKAGQAAFIGALESLREIETCTPLLAMRADFYPDLMNSDLWPVNAGQRLEIALLRGEALRQAIQQPAADVGVYLEAGLVERLLADAADEPGVLPLVQETMVLLWGEMKHRLLPLSAYERLGGDGRSGLAVAIAEKADAVLAGLSSDQQAIARRIFLRLVQFGEGRADTRRQQPVSVLRTTGDDPRLFDRTLRQLADNRLLTLSSEEEAPERQVDLAHEALISGWPRFQEWLVERRDAEQTRRRLEAKATEWVGFGRGDRGLLDLYELRDAEQWLDSPDAEELGVSKALVALAAKSREAIEIAEQERETARQKRAKAELEADQAREQAKVDRETAGRLRRRAIALGLALLVALIAAGVAAWLSNEARLARDSAEESAIVAGVARQTAEAAATAEATARLATEAEKQNVEKANRRLTAGELADFALAELNQRQDPSGSLALLLARQAVRTTLRRDGIVEPAALAALNQAIVAAPPWRATLQGHKGSVYSAAFSPDGERVVTASEDYTARIWDISTMLDTGAKTEQELLQLRGHTASVNFAAFSPDGRHVVTASSDKTARIWDAETGRELLQLDGHRAAVVSAVFDPDGDRIATVSGSPLEGDITVRIWDAATGRKLQQLAGHTKYINSAVFSPDGDHIATSSDDETARIWDVETGEELLRLNGHTGWVHSADFSPDGDRIVTASADQTARVWDVETGQELFELAGHTDWVLSAAFDLDGKRIVTSSGSPSNRDNNVRVWDAETGQELLQLTGHTDRVFSAAFSPDGDRIVTASADQTARVWDTKRQQDLLELQGHTGPVRSATFSPQGDRIVTASEDHSARVWDVETGQELLTLKGQALPVYWAAFSPDGDRIVTAGSEWAARVWDAATGQELLRLRHSDAVNSAVFAPDGDFIVTASSDDTARLWDISAALDTGAETGQELLRLEGHRLSVNSAALSPGGNRIVTASDDETARVWDARTGQELLQLKASIAPVNSAAFSPDGDRVVTASGGTFEEDNTAYVWDAKTGRLLLKLSGHAGWVNSAAFSPDGKHIVTASSDGTVRIWDAGNGEEILQIRGHTGIIWSAAYSSDGRRIVSASSDGTARTWLADIYDLLALAESLIQRDNFEFTPEERCRYLHVCE